MSQNTSKPIAPSFVCPGRVTVDQRGHSVWQWEGMDTDSTSLLLKRLENDALELEPTRSVPTPGGTGPTARGAARDAPSGGDRPDGVRGTSSARAAGTRRTRPRRAAAPAQADEGIQLEATLSVRYGGGFDPYDNTPR